MKLLIRVSIFTILSINITFAQKLVFFNSKKLTETINSELTEVLPILSGDGNTLYFVRDGLYGGEGQEDIWYSKKDESGEWTEARNDLKNLNNKFGNFIVGVNRENNSIYLRNAYDKKMKDMISVVSSTFTDGNWQEPKAIPALPDFGFRGKYYNMYLSHNEKYLFISMNIAGTEGKEDLYLLTKGDNNIWSQPIHLGSNVNSKEVEMSPFITEDGKFLFFASDGHGGYGDMDIFFSERLDDTYKNWSDPKNLGININSSGFDAYFHMSHDNKVFYSSTRGEAQYEDIYTSEMYLFEKKKRTVIIHDINNYEVLTDKGGEKEKKFKFINIEPLRDFLVTQKGDTLLTGDLADYDYNIIFQLDSGSKLEEKLIRLKNIKGYETLEELFVNEKILQGETMNLENLDAIINLLDEIEKGVKELEKIDSEPVKEESPVIAEVKNLFPNGMTLKTVNHDYDSDKSKGINIDKVISILKTNPYLKISIESHTDSKGSNEYNMALSDRRAASAKTYLLRKGISKSRIEVKAFGETKPISENSKIDGTDNPEGRAKNRRTEFNVISNKKF